MDAGLPDSARDVHPDAAKLIFDLPLPVALLDTSGELELANARFSRLFAAVRLGAADMSAILGRPAGEPRTLYLPGRDGALVEVRAQMSRLNDGVLLLADERAGTAYSSQLEHLHRRIAELEKLSATDPLTGAWNRAHLDRVVEAELSRSRRLRQPVSLVLLDIDHFKGVNDRYGHAAGDVVLREIVDVIRSCIRSADMLFRWGGEEFVVLAAATGYRQAEIMAETLRSRIEQHSFSSAGQVTASVGVAEHAGNETAMDWFCRVDMALYAAKNGGRNRVRVDRQGSSDIWADSGVSVLNLVWAESYECGEPTIDSQHRELFDLANALINASFAKEASPELYAAALDRLLTHIARHFAYEEAVLKQRGYANLEAHKRAHAGLLARAQEIKADSTAGKASLGGLIEFLANDVVARHLFSADREFFGLFASPDPGAVGASK